MKNYLGQKKRILLVESQPIIQQGLYSIIQEQEDLELIPNTCHADELIDTISSENPDLVILDLPYSNTAILDLIEKIYSKEPQVKILVFSVHKESYFGERAIRAGAMGYINKTENMDNLLNAIYQVLEGKVHITSNVAHQMFHSNYATIPSNKNSLIDSLSIREFEIFEMIGKGMETRSIANKLQLSVKTIETHRYNIKRKLMLDSGSELTRYAFEYSLSKPVEQAENKSAY